MRFGQSHGSARSNVGWATDLEMAARDSRLFRDTILPVNA